MSKQDECIAHFLLRLAQTRVYMTTTSQDTQDRVVWPLLQYMRKSLVSQPKTVPAGVI